MAGTQVGTAWIAITPSFQGFAGNIMSSLTGDLTQAGESAGDGAGDAAGEAFGSSFSDRVAGMSDRMAGAGAVAGGIVAAALGAGMAQAMDTSAANARLTAQLGLTEAEAQRAGDVAGAVFKDGFGGSVTEVSDAVGALASGMGGLGDVTDAELQHATTAALGLAETFQIDVSEAATAAGQLINQGLVKDTTEAFDVMTAAARTLPQSMVADIPAVISEYGIHFSRLGLDAQTAFGLMSQYVEAGGRDIDQAADVIHEFARITSEETDRAAAGFEALGLNADKMLADIGKGGPAAEAALTTTLEALRGVKDPAEQAALGVELFGDMAGEGATALWAMDPATAAASSGMKDAAGASKGLTDTLAADPGRQFTSSMRELTSALGDALMPVLTKVASFATEHPTLFKVIAFAVLGAAAAFAVLTAALWAVNVAVMANPVTWIVLAVIAAVVALAAIVALVVAHWDTIVAATKAAWNWLVAALTSMWNSIVSGVQAAWNWIASIISRAWNWITRLVAAVNPVGTITSHWRKITSATGAAWNWVLSTIRRIWNGIVSTVTSVASRVWSAISSAWSRVRSATSTAFSAVRKAIANALTNAYNSVRNIGSRFLSIGRGIVQGIVRGVRNAAGSLFSSLRNLASNALSSAKNFLGIGSPSRLFALEVGQWIPAGVELGIERGEPELTQRIDHMVRVPAAPTVRASVATGAAATPAPVIIRADGNRASRALIAVIQDAVRTQLGGDVNRLSGT